MITLERAEKKEKIKQEHIHELLFSEELSWQAILYDLINTEQLDPWDIDLVLLTGKYLTKIQALEEANFFVSSKVLFAAALLLRIKSEILLEKDIRNLDEILFGKKEEQSYKLERIELAEGEIPELIPKTPLPRFRKVSLQELMEALNKAMNTETRRIRKEIEIRQLREGVDLNLPKKTIKLTDKIKEIVAKIKFLFQKKEKIAFSELAKNREEKLSTFVPLLHLDTQEKIWLEQEKHFGEIWILMYESYLKKQLDKANENPLERFFDLHSEIQKMGEVNLCD